MQQQSIWIEYDGEWINVTFREVRDKDDLLRIEIIDDLPPDYSEYEIKNRIDEKLMQIR